MATRCCWPPESSSGYLREVGREAEAVGQARLPGRVGAPGEAGLEGEVGAGVERGDQVELLEHDAHRVAAERARGPGRRAS